MTLLSKPVVRLTRKTYGRRPVVIKMAPVGTENEVLIVLRLLGERTQYVVALSDLYRIAAMWHGQKEAAAKRKARREGVSWRIAKKHFLASLKV